MVVALCVDLAASQPNIDGGRGDLPGMKQDMFDQINRQKKGQQQRQGKGPPDCPKSDKMTPFASLCFTGGDLFVRMDALEGTCHKLLSIGGANLTVLRNASLTCGPAGEWKKRVAEEMSMVFFQGGLDWVRNENETIEVITEEGTFQAEINEAKYATMMDCWKRGCSCEQANNPKMKIILFTLLMCALGGVSYDSFKLAWEQFRGAKPSKHVECKKGHRMVEVKEQYSHICDICRKSGTTYQCTASCNYDMCKVCYKAAKKKQRAKYKEYLEKHPEDEDNKKKDKDDDDKDDDDAKKDGGDSQSEAGDKKDSKKESEAESDAPPSSEADKDGATGDEKAKSEKSEKSEEEEK
jgi:hypothetical protein